MKKLGLLIITLVAYLGVNGQANNQLNFGFGLNSFQNSIPIYISYDFVAAEDITVAPVVQLDIANINWMTIGVRADYYFDRLFGSNKHWDFYAGANAGFLWWFDTISGTSDLDLGLEAGTRYWFNEKWAINFEMGGGSSFSSKLGVSMSL